MLRMGAWLLFEYNNFYKVCLIVLFMVNKKGQGCVYVSIAIVLFLLLVIA